MSLLNRVVEYSFGSAENVLAFCQEENPATVKVIHHDCKIELIPTGHVRPVLFKIYNGSLLEFCNGVTVGEYYQYYETNVIIYQLFQSRNISYIQNLSYMKSKPLIIAPSWLSEKPHNSGQLLRIKTGIQGYESKYGRFVGLTPDKKLVLEYFRNNKWRKFVVRSDQVLRCVFVQVEHDGVAIYNDSKKIIKENSWEKAVNSCKEDGQVMIYNTFEKYSIVVSSILEEKTIYWLNEIYSEDNKWAIEGFKRHLS